jgi:hypothetical protein
MSEAADKEATNETACAAIERGMAASPDTTIRYDPFT